MLEPSLDDDNEPAFDPLSLPIANFAAPFRPPANSDHGSVSKEIPVGQRRRRRTSGMEVLHKREGSGPRRLDELDDGPRSPVPAPSRELTEMSDESIEAMLDADFRAWDASGVGAGEPPPPPDDGDLEAILSRGLGDMPAAEPPRPPPRPTSAPPTAKTPPVVAKPAPPPVVAKPAPPVVAKPAPPPVAEKPVAPPPMAVRAPSPPPRPVAPPPVATPPAKSGPPPMAITPPMAVKPAAAKAADPLEAIIRAGLADLDALEAKAPPSASPPPRAVIEAPPPGTDLDALMATARRRQQAGDFSGSLELVEQVLLADPEHAQARRYMEENTDRLLSMYRSRLGPLTHRPRVRMKPQEIIWQSLDHRAGYVLSQCDGMTSFQEIVDICGMAELETTRILARLVDQRVIG
jgi:hypothetical protein